MDSTSMESSAICRICLAEDAKMYLIAKTSIQEIYEKLTEMPLVTEDCRSLLVCYICHARLKTCYQLKMNCLQTEQLLTQMSSNMLKQSKLKPFSRYTLAMTAIVHINIENIDGLTDGVGVKMEELIEESKEIVVKEEDMEEEKHEILEDHSIEMDNVDNSTDSEDNVPLKIIKIKSERKVKKKKRLKVRKKESNALKTSQKLDAHEIILTKEEQLANLQARAKTMNYTLSPYKCEMCFKGFVDTNAYKNHIIKHDKSSGVHSCEICQLRYRSAQQLRTHSVTAHSRLFRCNICGHTSHTANQARVHEKWHSGYMYECQLCGHKFKKPTSYLSHMRKRHPTEHVCNICGETFVGKHGLQMHKSKSHRHDVKKHENPEEPTTDRFCSECDILFYNKDAWKRHILCSVKHALSNETSKSCTICGWVGSPAALRRHLRDHSRSLRLSRPRAVLPTDKLHCHCGQCGANFGNRQKLQQHINRMHLGRKYNKHIVCEICGKHCTSNATLKYHQRTHTGERPYTCSTCSKQFSDSNQLKIHTRTHTGEKPYECGVCGKRFTQKPALNRHYRVHTGDKPYICQYCSRTFSQSNSLKLHVRTVHLKLPANNKKKISTLQDSIEKTEEKELVGQEAVA